jgi:hypothetical protein
VRVADDKLPADLKLFASIPQHLLVDSSRARQLLGWRWRETDAEQAVGESVQWHLAHPPADPDGASPTTTPRWPRPAPVPGAIAGPRAP